MDTKANIVPAYLPVGWKYRYFLGTHIWTYLDNKDLQIVASQSCIDFRDTPKGLEIIYIADETLRPELCGWYVHFLDKGKGITAYPRAGTKIDGYEYTRGPFTEGDAVEWSLTLGNDYEFRKRHLYPIDYSLDIPGWEHSEHLLSDLWRSKENMLYVLILKPEYSHHYSVWKYVQHPSKEEWETKEQLEKDIVGKKAGVERVRWYAEHTTVPEDPLYEYLRKWGKVMEGLSPEQTVAMTELMEGGMTPADAYKKILGYPTDHPGHQDGNPGNDEEENKLKGEKVWQMDERRYQSLMGVHQPWIAEISPAQYAGMSGRAQREYSKRRDAEWQASYDIKQEWYEKVTQAYVLGKFKLEDPGVSEAAKTAVWRYERDLKEEREKVAHDQAVKENRIISVLDLEIGDRVHCIMYREYGTVIKKFKKSIRVRWEKPLTGGATETTLEAGYFQWWDYNDMVERVKQGLPIRPVRGPVQEPPAAAPEPAAAPPTELTELVEEDECTLTQQQIGYWKGQALKDIREKSFDAAWKIVDYFYDHGCNKVADRIEELLSGAEEQETAAKGHVHDKYYCPICGNFRVCGICGKEWYGSASGSKNYPTLCEECADAEFEKEMKEFWKKEEKEYAKLDRELQKDEAQPAFLGHEWECFKSGLEYWEAIKLEGQLRRAGRTVRKEPRGDKWDVYIRSWDTAAAPPTELEEKEMAWPDEDVGYTFIDDVLGKATLVKKQSSKKCPSCKIPMQIWKVEKAINPHIYVCHKCGYIPLDDASGEAGTSTLEAYLGVQEQPPGPQLPAQEEQRTLEQYLNGG